MTTVAGPTGLSEGRLIKLLNAMPAEQREKLMAMTVPRMVTDYQKHIPHAKQQFFLSLNASREVMYGGSAGGGKSDALLMAALQYVDVPGYSALILRRTWPDLNSSGAILDRARTWLANTPAKEKNGGRDFVFPSGARLSFAYMQHDKDRYKFASAEYQFIGFDELTQFPQLQYEFLFSRLRRTKLPCLNCGTGVKDYGGRWRHSSSRMQKNCPGVFPDPKMLSQFAPAPDGTSLWNIPLRVRSATNPGGIGHEWVYNHFINPKTKKDGSIFVPASLRDNPSLDQDEYRKSLMHLSGAERERLLNGDWTVFEQGGFLQRHWFDVVDQVPHGNGIKRIRAWDMAASENTGDYTVGALLALFEGVWYLESVVRGQWSSAQAQRILEQTALQDGRSVPIRMEQEGGSAGKTVIDHYRRGIFVGYDFDGVKATGSKEARAKPWAVAAENRNFKIVAGQWNAAFLDECELFPLGAHDDMVDAVSLGVTSLSAKRQLRILA